jgi:hypothetical protein
VARCRYLGLWRANIDQLGSSDGCHTLIDAIEGTLDTSCAG